MNGFLGVYSSGICDKEIVSLYLLFNLDVIELVLSKNTSGLNFLIQRNWESNWFEKKVVLFHPFKPSKPFQRILTANLSNPQGKPRESLYSEHPAEMREREGEEERGRDAPTLNGVREWMVVCDGASRSMGRNPGTHLHPPPPPLHLSLQEHHRTAPWRGPHLFTRGTSHAAPTAPKVRTPSGITNTPPPLTPRYWPPTTPNKYPTP